jgi:hypothetical protein
MAKGTITQEMTQEEFHGLVQVLDRAANLGTRLSNNTSATSSTLTCSPPAVAAIASLIMFKQNGQAVANVWAPVPTASAARKRETRCAGGSSNHIRPPPAPQQNVFVPWRGISEAFRPVAD